jgi:hypothetical protein
VNPVTRYARQALGLMGTPLPEQPLAFFMALQTAGILLACGQGRGLAQTDNEFGAPWALVGLAAGARLIAGVRFVHVLAGRPVARFAPP